MSDHLLYSVEDGIATITLNRPDRMNAVTYPMLVDLLAIFDRIDADDEVKAVIVTGAGDRAFCAGADLSTGGKTFDYKNRPELSERPMVNGVYLDTGGRVTLRIFESLKPIIAAINGAAVGFGATFVLPMDVRIASDKARFSYLFGRRGLVPEAASAWFLPRVVGISTALEWTYSGRMVGVDEALQNGLVRSLHPEAELLAAARELAHSFVDDTAPVSAALTRQMMWRMLGADHPMEAHKIDSRAITARGQSKDIAEGIAAYSEKRRPRFPDRVSEDMPPFFPWWRPRKFE